MGTDLLDSGADTFSLPDMRETVEGLTDCIAGFLGPKWCASANEIDRISKPAARIVGRNQKLKRAINRFSAPGVLAGALAAYLGARIWNAPVTAAGTLSVGQPPATREAPAAASSSPSAPIAQPAPPPPAPPQNVNTSGVEPPKMDAVQAQALIDEMTSTVVGM